MRRHYCHFMFTAAGSKGIMYAPEDSWHLLVGVYMLHYIHSSNKNDQGPAMHPEAAAPTPENSSGGKPLPACNEEVRTVSKHPV
jgi:hypothetical protein